MGLRFKCPHCGRLLPVDGDTLGSVKPCLQCGGTVELSANPLTDGYVLGDFVIVGPLGAGRDGSVYMAEEANTGELVALRVPSDEGTGGGENAENFLSQIGQLRDFGHPRLARVITPGRTSDHCFYFMEY